MQRYTDRILKYAILILICCLFAGSSFGDLKVVNDPAQVGVGARSLGMGGVLLNFSDISGLFGNPASLVSIDKPQYTFMSGRFLDEVDYNSLGIAFPTLVGAIGIGYSSSQLSFTGPLTTTEVVGGDIRIVPSTTEVRTDTYKSSTLQLSFSKPARDFTQPGIFKNVVLGGTLKIFSQEIKAPGASGSASGQELDLGMYYAINPWTNFSLVGKNLLPAASGGKLVWKPTGREEPYPYYIKTGLSIKLDRGINIINIKDQSFTFALEHDYHPRGNVPDLLHYGLEWGLGGILDLRMGRDQGYIGRGGTELFDVADNATYGVGLTYRGWRFDYAFHEYYNIPDNNTQYFSISCGLPYLEEKKPEPRKVEVLPEDKLITDLASIEVSGWIQDGKIVGIFVNNKPLEVKDNAFRTRLDLSLGKNNIVINGVSEKGKALSSEIIRILRLINFQDVAPDYWAKDPVQILATLGIIKGYPDNTFKPRKEISRAELVTLLARLVGQETYQVEKKLPFKDLKLKHWAYKSIAYALDKELVKGYPDKTFRPNKTITRAEAVVITARFAGLDLATPIDELPYQDIPGRHWAVKEINAAKIAGLLEHIGVRFYPNEKLTRGEAAEILAKVKYIKDKVDDLLDFEKGYNGEEEVKQ